MKAPRIVNVIGHIDDDLITAAECRKKTSRNTRLKWSSIAACFALLVIIGATFLTALFNGNVTPTDSRYKSYAITYENSAIVWSWEYKAIYEKYTSLTLDGIEYGSRGRVVSEEFVGESVGRHTVIGYDNITSEYHTSIFEVYQLKYADKSQYVAVRMDGSCYIFKNNKYEPPNTLGELFILVDLPKSIELSRFSENGNSPDSKHFTLNSDDYMWDILASCEEAKFVEDDWWTAYDREYLSFTVTSEPLGVYKSAMYVTADGYLWTNAFDYGYLFYIGEDASGKIIKYAKENSIEAEYEPYQKSIAGTIIAEAGSIGGFNIGENYIGNKDLALLNNDLIRISPDRIIMVNTRYEKIDNITYEGQSETVLSPGRLIVTNVGNTVNSLALRARSGDYMLEVTRSGIRISKDGGILWTYLKYE